MSKNLDKFISDVQSAVTYWANVKDFTDEFRCYGVAFSIMNIIDGTEGESGPIDIGKNGNVWNRDRRLHEMMYKDKTP